MYTNSQPVISYDGPKSAKFYVFLKHLTPSSSIFPRTNLRILRIALKKVLKSYFSKHLTPEQCFFPKRSEKMMLPGKMNPIFVCFFVTFLDIFAF